MDLALSSQYVLGLYHIRPNEVAVQLHKFQIAYNSKECLPYSAIGSVVGSAVGSAVGSMVGSALESALELCSSVGRLYSLSSLSPLSSSKKYNI